MKNNELKSSIYQCSLDFLTVVSFVREKAEREKEAAKENETVDSDDDDVVFGNVSFGKFATSHILPTKILSC